MKYKMKSVLSILILTAMVALSAITPGCASKLEPGGVYAPVTTNEFGEIIVESQPDMALFLADSAFELAYDALDTAFTIERNNRLLLWKLSPDIKHTLDKIRVECVPVLSKWARARSAYIANPVPANLDTLQTLLAEVQRLQQAAAATLPK